MSTQINLTSPEQKELAGATTELLLARYNGEVQGTLESNSFFFNFIDSSMMVGTDTFTKKRIGKAVVKGVQPGSVPQADKVAFSDRSITVDTIILSRSSVFKLEDVQGSFDALSKIAEEQGKEMAIIYDEAALIANVKGAEAAAPSLAGWSSGTTAKMDGANDEDDPDKVVDKILNLVAKMKAKKVKTRDMVLVIEPILESILIKATYLNRLNDGGESSVAEYTLSNIAGLRVIVSTELPQEARSLALGNQHQLNSINNKTDFDVTADQALLLCSIVTKDSFLAATSVALQSLIHYDPMSLSNYIDSFTSYNISYDRPDLNAALFSSAYAGTIQ